MIFMVKLYSGRPSVSIPFFAAHSKVLGIFPIFWYRPRPEPPDDPSLS